MWHGAFFVGGMMVMIVLRPLFWPVEVRESAPVIAAHPSPGQDSSHVPASSSPWGELEFSPLALERPEQVWKENFTPPPLQWFFVQHSPDELRKFFKQLNRSEGAVLLNTNLWEILPNGIIVRPPIEFVEALSPSTRKAIYSVLARFRENPYHQWPLRIPSPSVHDYLAGYSIRPEILNLLRQLTYPGEFSLCLADLPLLHRHCTPEEFFQITKALSRIPTLMVKLRLRPDSDIDAILDYWRQVKTDQTIRPFLESLAKTTETGTSVNVALFFPPVPRLRLYTYPNPDQPHTAPRNCFWTAMNFFNEEPNDLFHDTEYVQRVLESEYEVIRDDWHFGDVLLLMEGSEAVHMANYVADDVVFTKNGANPFQPWVLMRIKDMVAQYPSKTIKVFGFRRKEFSS
jgi:hypothetical protein